MTIHNMSKETPTTLTYQITAYIVEIKYGGAKTLEHLTPTSRALGNLKNNR